MLTSKPIDKLPKLFDQVANEYSESESYGASKDSKLQNTEDGTHTETEPETGDAIELALSLNGTQFNGSYNIPPTSTGVIIFTQLDQKGRSKYVAEPLKFGLLPEWAKPRNSSPVKKKSGHGASYSKEVQTHQSKLFNCRRETLSQSKTVWAQPRAHNRCVVPISGYFEWQTSANGEKKPYYVHSDRSLLFIAGLFAHNRNYNDTDLVRSPMDYFSSFSIVTGPAEGKGSNDMKWLHSRKPIFIEPFSKEWNLWLDNSKDWNDTFLECLNSDSNPVYDDLQTYPVQSSVGNPKNDSKDTIKELKEKQLSITLFFSPRKSEAARKKSIVGLEKSNLTQKREYDVNANAENGILKKESESKQGYTSAEPIAKRIKRELQGSESILNCRYENEGEVDDEGFEED